MTPKNDTPALIVAFLLTTTVVGGGLWWFSRPGNLQGSNPASPAPSTSSSSQNPLAELGNRPSAPDFASVQVPQGSFSYGGSTSWAPIRLRIDSAIQAQRPEFGLRYQQPKQAAASSGTGIAMVQNNEIDFAQSSRALTPQEQQAGLQAIPVAIDGLAIAVNPNLNIPSLSLSQLAQIYAGQLTNWQQLGGPDLPIVPFYRASGGTTELFSEKVLQGQAFGPNVRAISTTTEALRQLAASPGGLYFASAPEVVPQCSIKPLPIEHNGARIAPYQQPYVPPSQCPAQRNQLNAQAFKTGQYPLTRSLYVIFKPSGPPNGPSPAGEAYANLLLSQQGQKQLAEAGFVPLR